MPLFDRTGPPGGAGPRTGRQMGYRDVEVAGQYGAGRRRAYGEETGWISKISQEGGSLLPGTIIALGVGGFILFKVLTGAARKLG